MIHAILYLIKMLKLLIQLVVVNSNSINIGENDIFIILMYVLIKHDYLYLDFKQNKSSMNQLIIYAYKCEVEFIYSGQINVFKNINFMFYSYIK